MEKKELAERLAKQTKQPAGVAADQLDQALHAVLRSLKTGTRTRPNALQRLIEEAQWAPTATKQNGE